MARTIDGRRGALRLRYPDEITEAKRLGRGLGSAWCPTEPQGHLMFAFDALIANRARDRDNILWHNETSDLVLTDHARAFVLETAFSASAVVSPCRQ